MSGKECGRRGLRRRKWRNERRRIRNEEPEAMIYGTMIVVVSLLHQLVVSCWRRAAAAATTKNKRGLMIPAAAPLTICTDSLSSSSSAGFVVVFVVHDDRDAMATIDPHARFSLVAVRRQRLRSRQLRRHAVTYYPSYRCGGLRSPATRPGCEPQHHLCGWPSTAERAWPPSQAAPGRTPSRSCARQARMGGW